MSRQGKPIAKIPSRRLTKASSSPTVRGLAPLLAQIRALVSGARQAAAATANALHVRTNFEIGRRIVEHEQHGSKRAGYGDAVLSSLSTRLTTEFGRGFSIANLEYMRRFYLEWRDRSPRLPWLTAIPQKASGESRARVPAIPQKASGELVLPGVLSWSHYVLLLTISDLAERSFYEIEAAREGWSLPELKRQVASCLYERLALSRNRRRVAELSTKGQVIARPEDLLKEPLILEFLGLGDHSAYSESDLESAIITQIERFLLEIGKGFLFEARQKRFTFDEDHFFVDLVFYNRLLRCYVLIDLKLDKLTHQDLGQMQMYVNHFDRTVRQPDENPTVGIVLCKRKKQALVELTLPKGANIHASEYQLYLPSKALLRRKLLDWTRDAEAGV